MSARPLVVLVGPPGAGTSTVARELGGLTGAPVLDTERLAAAALGHEDVAVAFVVTGEEAFRAAETEAALTALTAHEGAVVALGSGALLAPEVRSAVGPHPLVQLTVSLAQAAPRLGLATARPVFLGNPRAQWVRQAAERAELYASVATATVDTDDRTPREVAELVLAGLRKPEETT